MSTKKNMPWFRLYTEIIDDEKMLLLAFEDRWHYIALLACKGKGLLDKDESADLMFRKIALKLGLARRELDEAARRLADAGLIDQATLQPLAWNDRQFESDSSTKRVHEYRKRKAESMKRQCNVSVTAQDTDTDTDTDNTLSDAREARQPVENFAESQMGWLVEHCPSLSLAAMETEQQKLAARYPDGVTLAEYSLWMLNAERHFADKRQQRIGPLSAAEMSLAVGNLKRTAGSRS